MQRRLGEGEDAEGCEGGGRERQGAVHVGQAEALGDAGMDREGLGPGAAGAGRVHQPPAWPPFSAAASARAGPRKYASRIFLAAGAADSTPKPPSSIVTKVTIRGFGIRGEDAVPGLVRVRRALGGAGLARDRDREAAEDVEGGAAAVLRGVVQPFEDRRPVFGVDVNVPARPRVEFLQHPAGWASLISCRRGG